MQIAKSKRKTIGWHILSFFYKLVNAKSKCRTLGDALINFYDIRLLED
jgi:hypothetical protein